MTTPPTEPAPSPPTPERRPGLYRRFYNWVLHWAYTPFATPALFVMSFAESSFFPIPPDVLMIPMCISNRKRAMWYATVCSVASILGGMFGYWIGASLWDAGAREIFFDYGQYFGFKEAKFDQIKGLYDDYDFWIVFIAGFSPIPYKVFTVAGGVFDISFGMFVIASAVSRSARFFLVATLLKIWGEPIREFIERRLGLVSIVFCVLLIAGFVIIPKLL